MKRFLTCILALSLFAPLGCTYFYLQWQKKQVKRAVKHRIIEGLSRSEMCLLRFDKKTIDQEVEWEHSKEFEYKGVMYDVVESSSTKDSVFYWCWKDDDETALNQQLTALLNLQLENQPIGNDANEKLVQYYKKLFFSNKSIELAKLNGISNIDYYWSNNYQSLSTSPHYPPPKV